MTDKEESRYIRELKKQIIKLKRENQQLKKSKRRMEHLIDEAEDDEPVEPPKPFKTSSDKDSETCPKCESEDIITFELRKIQYYKCGACESKGRLVKL